MSSFTHSKLTVALPPWLTKDGVDLSKYPIDTVLRQALSDNEQQFRSACILLMSMSHLGRTEAGVFLVGLLGHYPKNYQRLTLIAEALQWHRAAATVEALASELRRVKGSSATRGYLRRIIETLAQFPSELVDEKIDELASDPRVGARFRDHLRSIARRRLDDFFDDA